MKVINKVIRLRKRIARLNLRPVGFVPTMGALHRGHLSLAEKAVSECPLVVVSIYVNPSQFNEADDLKNYPRTPEEDLELLCRVLRKNDLVFMPDDREIYPAEDNRVFSFGNLDNVMEALHRPGHFNGVAKVVTRLFEIVNPDIAWFGIKDLQQLAVIRKLAVQTGNSVVIKGSPIVRESDGLAMSSRNALLEPAIRKNAGVIFRTISEASEMIHDHTMDEIKEYVINKISECPGFSVEYFEIADDTDLVTLSEKCEMQEGKDYFACIAVRAGKIRLIDNIGIRL